MAINSWIHTLITDKVRAKQPAAVDMAKLPSVAPACGCHIYSLGRGVLLVDPAA